MGLFFVGNAWVRIAQNGVPKDQFEFAFGGFNQGAKALNSIAIVAINESVDFPNFSFMNVPTNDAIAIAHTGLARHDVLKISNVAHRILDLVL
jgi:hypothetical protein